MATEVMGAEAPPRRAFVSYSSIDKPAVKTLFDTLHDRGIDQREAQ